LIHGLGWYCEWLECNTNRNYFLNTLDGDEKTVKIAKLPIVGRIVVLAIAIILTVFPTWTMNQIQIQINNGNSAVPAYKLTESLQYWQIANITIFQPLSILLYIVATILLVAGVIMTLAMHVHLQIKDTKDSS
jgi:hypothetical protein